VEDCNCLLFQDKISVGFGGGIGDFVLICYTKSFCKTTNLNRNRAFTFKQNLKSSHHLLV